MTKEDITEDIILSSINYIESEHILFTFEVRPSFLWVVKNREKDVDEIQRLFTFHWSDVKVNQIPLRVKRFYKSFSVIIKIQNVNESECNEIITEVFEKFKIQNDNEIYCPYKYYNQFHGGYLSFDVYDNKQIYSFPKFRELGQYIVSR